ncbi:hypothetical protein OO5_00586 [Enterococcus faecalis V583]|uniref:hypothetical protein n=1 Tax=Enterococcus faecalis TaxID=1351 RepID=UPI000334D91A|nr:hypothetical protein [Enterococcus faecalis]EOT51996.1 hypothetical protein OO5_00586 [Enterococcus faecalis V583]
MNTIKDPNVGGVFAASANPKVNNRTKDLLPTVGIPEAPLVPLYRNDREFNSMEEFDQFECSVHSPVIVRPTNVMPSFETRIEKASEVSKEEGEASVVTTAHQLTEHVSLASGIEVNILTKP